MTDLEMTKLCAEAMGWTAEIVSNCVMARIVHREHDGWRGASTFHFEPLTNDAQAMALVFWLADRGELDIGASYVRFETKRIKPRHEGDTTCWSFLMHGTPGQKRRAIVECVAKMRLADNK